MSTVSKPDLNAFNWRLYKNTKKNVIKKWNSCIEDIELGINPKQLMLEYYETINKAIKQRPIESENKKWKSGNYQISTIFSNYEINYRRRVKAKESFKADKRRKGKQV